MKFREIIIKSAQKRIIFTIHALDEMNKEEEIITSDEVKNVILNGEIIEDYPEDKRGHSCLMLGFTQIRRPIHIVCSPKQEYIAIITAYIPNLFYWGNNFKTRKK